MTDPTTSEPLRALADLVAERARGPAPAPVVHAARRTVGNVLATAVGAAHQPAVDVTVAALPPGSALVPGRAERLGPEDAALVTGLAAHLDDYDDTHLSLIHI